MTMNNFGEETTRIDEIRLTNNQGQQTKETEN